METLHTKYRPQLLEEVLGHEQAIKSIAAAFNSKKVPHAFLFTGPSGTGKTTLARIIANNLNCPDQNVVEIDGARFSGIENMRQIISSTAYTALTDRGTKVYILDECHALGKGTWQTLLKIIEEPPPHVYWCLCTTEPDKVPATIRTRCHTYDLKPVQWEEIAEHLTRVAKDEKIKLPTEIIDLAARKSMGSPRQALVFLSMLRGITNKAEALALLEEVPDGEDNAALTLARMVCDGRKVPWEKIQPLFEQLKEMNPESVRLMVINYAAAVLTGAKAETKAAHLVRVIDCFSTPCNPSEKLAPILLAVGRLTLE